MSQERKDRVNGALFKNQKKEEKKHPDYFGVVNMTEDFARDLYNQCRSAKNGEVKIQISGWIKEPKDRDKDKYISLAFDYGAKGRSDAKSRERDDDRGRAKRPEFDDEIPF